MFWGVVWGHFDHYFLNDLNRSLFLWLTIQVILQTYVI